MMLLIESQPWGQHESKSSCALQNDLGAHEGMTVLFAVYLPGRKLQERKGHVAVMPA